jgi:alkanesulfonate monooxygenase SsuD/methylene tetrahydromethanopterin reductase-like flavin-dependent oxidoreductase (luciferase family)
VHLPLADFGDGRQTATGLQAYARTAQELGYTTLAPNDHLLWRRPWLDGPTALASVAAAAGEMTLATTVALPVVRHPIVVAKMLTTLAVLSRGPVVGGPLRGGAVQLRRCRSRRSCCGPGATASISSSAA